MELRMEFVPHQVQKDTCMVSRDSLMLYPKLKKKKKKLTKKISYTSEDTWAVDVDYNGIPIVEQIEGKIVSAIGRINGPVLNIMKLFGIQQLSPYCTDVQSIKDLCAIYQSSSRQENFISINEMEIREIR